MRCRFIQHFCEEVYAVAFFNVVQQQTIGKVENSITRFCGQIISVCNSERIKSDSIFKSYAQMKKGPVFLTRSVVFQHQTAWQYSDGNGGVECRWGRQHRDSEPIWLHCVLSTL